MGWSYLVLGWHLKNKLILVLTAIAFVAGLFTTNYATAQKFDGSIGVISIGFDHGFKEQFQASQYMTNDGFKGTFYIVTNRAIDTNFLSWDELTTLYNGGWEMASHSRNHIPEDELTQTQLNSEIISSKIDLQSHGMKVCGFVSPDALKPNATIINIIQTNYNYTLIKDTTQNNVSSLSAKNFFNIPVKIPIVKAMTVGDVGTSPKNGYGQVSNFKQAKTQIDSAILNHSWVVLHFHDFTNSTIQVQTLQVPTTWNLYHQIINYIKQKHTQGVLDVERQTDALGLTC